MLSFGYFLRTAESPIAPDQGRIGLQQAFPWPTKLTAGADAASAGARAMQAEFEARALAVSQRVANAYWNLWQLRRTRSIHREHLDVVRSLSQSVRARIASGTAMLADLQQIDLTAARLEDGIRGMDETERAFEARLRETIGLEPHVVVPTPKPPEHAALPSLGADVLREAARSHPMIASRGFMAESADSSARAEAADRLPSFLVGVSWMISADAGMPGGVDFGAGVSLPLWQGSYSDAIEAARADAHAQRAEQQTLVNRAFAELEATLSGVRDAARRVHLYENTLVPQAESAYESVLGAYTVGRGSVAETLLAQRDLLDLRVELDRARADHARSWARLEEVTGRELRGAANHEVKNE
jgi:outer membrane protein TolC